MTWIKNFTLKARLLENLNASFHKTYYLPFINKYYDKKTIQTKLFQLIVWDFQYNLKKKTVFSLTKVLFLPDSCFAKIKFKLQFWVRFTFVPNYFVHILNAMGFDCQDVLKFQGTKVYWGSKGKGASSDFT